LKAVFGIAYQFAVSPELTTKPVLTPVHNRAWLLALRCRFEALMVAGFVRKVESWALRPSVRPLVSMLRGSAIANSQLCLGRNFS